MAGALPPDLASGKVTGKRTQMSSRNPGENYREQAFRKPNPFKLSFSNHDGAHDRVHDTVL
jgi:hypothetical protein